LSIKNTSNLALNHTNQASKSNNLDNNQQNLMQYQNQHLLFNGNNPNGSAAAAAAHKYLFNKFFLFSLTFKKFYALKSKSIKFIFCIQTFSATIKP